MLIERDFDLLKQIDKQAILSSDLNEKLNRGVIITYFFLTLDDANGHIFEVGAPPPTLRLEILEKTIKKGFLFGGVSLMPLIPFIGDTGDHLENMFQTFQRLKVN
jgi:DNA repair photolyase